MSELYWAEIPIMINAIAIMQQTEYILLMCRILIKNLAESNLVRKHDAINDLDM